MTAANTCVPANILGVRWDAVVAPSLRTGDAAPPLAQSNTGRSADSIQVRVQLFGALATASAQRSVRLELPAVTSIADVLASAEARLGVSLLSHVIDETGAKRRHCRLFVGGYAVEDLRTPLPATSNLTEIEIILLIAPEGG